MSWLVWACLFLHASSLALPHGRNSVDHDISLHGAALRSLLLRQHHGFDEGSTGPPPVRVHSAPRASCTPTTVVDRAGAAVPLAAFYHALNGPAWPAHEQHGWLDPHISVCCWFGVYCTDQGEVCLGTSQCTSAYSYNLGEDLSLFSTLSGSLPEALCNTTIAQGSAGSTVFGGTSPACLWRVNLNGNAGLQALPSSLPLCAACSSGTWSVAHTGITSFPSSFPDFRVERLNIAGLPLRSTDFASWTHSPLSTSVESLNASSLALLHQFPESWCTFGALISLYFSAPLVTTLPACMRNITTLLDLTLSLSGLTALPATFGEGWSDLNSLALTAPMLQGLPHGWHSRLPHVHYVSFVQVPLSAQELSRLPSNVQVLELVETSALFSPDFCDLSALNSISIFSPTTAVSLPECAYNLTSLRNVRLKVVPSTFTTLSTVWCNLTALERLFNLIFTMFSTLTG